MGPASKAPVDRAARRQGEAIADVEIESDELGERQRVSDYTVRRLSMYYRILEDLERTGKHVVSSAALAKVAGTNSAQVRKDLSYFGNFGKRGRGYVVSVPQGNAVKDIIVRSEHLEPYTGS